MSGVRSTKAKAPWVGLSGSGGPGTDELVKVTAADTTPDYLGGKIGAGIGISLSLDNPGGDETLVISADLQPEYDEKVKVSNLDTTPGYLTQKIVAGANISLTPSGVGNETLTIAAAADTDQLVKIEAGDTTAGYLFDKLRTTSAIGRTIYNPGGLGNKYLELSLMPSLDMAPELDYHDFFTIARPFWDNTQVIRDGYWTVDTANLCLRGIAEGGTGRAWFRRGIEGNFDYAFRFDIGSASSCGVWFEGVDEFGNAQTISFKKVGGNSEVQFTGGSLSTVPLAASAFWFRVKRTGDDLVLYTAPDSAEPQGTWVVRYTFGNFHMGYNVKASLDHGTTTRLYQIRLIDNVDPMQFRAGYSNSSYLTDAATIAIDASRGNIFNVTLNANRTLGNPTNGIDGQMITIRVKQDFTGGRTLSYSGDYRFSTDLPVPVLSTGSQKTDYLSFIYNEYASKWDFIGKVFGF
jgi:hypothetical protein